MTIRIGGGRNGRGRANPPRPTNYQVGERARQRIDSIMPRMAEYRTQSIAVDPTPILVWRRGKGSQPCTCTTTRLQNNLHSIAFDRGTTRIEDMASANLGNTAVPQTTSIGLGGLGDDYRSEFEEGVNPFDNSVEPEFDPDFAEARVDEPTEEDSGWLDRVIEEGPFQTGQATKCPVCFGSSYTDTWKPFKGVRVLGDLAEQTKWTESGGDLQTDARPSVMRLPVGASITWRLFIPKFFHKVLRSQVWNGFRKVKELPQVNLQPITNPASPLPQWVDATPANLASLQGNGQELEFRLTAVRGDLELTHFEILIMLDEFGQAHVPEIDVPYDSEFVDYNTVVTMELPIDADVGEGDILAENKHGRLWLATSVSKKQTGSGKSYGSDATFRTIHANEVYYPMNVFKER